MRFVLLIAMLLVATKAIAQDGAECFSKYTKFNACEAARSLHSELVKDLPMTLSANIRLVKAVVFGSRVEITALWSQTKPELDDIIRRSGLQAVEMGSRMKAFMKNSICGEPTSAAFIRLGGQIQFRYQTIDGYNPFSPIVSECPYN